MSGSYNPILFIFLNYLELQTSKSVCVAQEIYMHTYISKNYAGILKLLTDTCGWKSTIVLNC